MSAKRFFYVLIAFLILSFLSILGAFYLGNAQLQTKSQEIGDLLAKRDVSQEKIVRLQQASKDANNLDSVVELLDRLLPKEKQQDKLIADIIYTATAQAGIPFNQVTSFSFSGSAEPDTLSGTTAVREHPGVFEYPFSLQIEDITYQTLLTLLNRIEGNGRLVQVANVQITPGQENPNVVSVNLSAKAYVRP